MAVKHIGIITGGLQSQSGVNTNHAHDIGKALKDEYIIHYYDLSLAADRKQLITDKENKELDIVFNNAAGKYGGDGTVEGFLTVIGVPFVGSDTLATAVAFDKRMTKSLVRQVGIPVAPGITLSERLYRENPEKAAQFIERSLDFPQVVKASRGSDSIGISLVKDISELSAALEKAFKEDDEVVIEKYIVRVAEITCMVFGDNKEITTFDPVENYYETDLLGVGGPVTRRVPTMKKRILNRIRTLSMQAHRVVGCNDYSRSDFLVDHSGQIFFLEINGHAGLGKESPTTFSAQTTHGWDHPQLIKEILNLAIKRHQL